MNWDAWKPLATLIFTSLLKFAGGLLVAHGLATNGPGLEAIGGAATTAAGALWSWWVQKGHLAAADYLKKLTDTATTAAAVAVAKQMAPAATTGAAQEAHQEVAIETGKIVPKAAPIVLLAILILGTLAFPGDAMAAQIKKPQITGDFAADAKANLGIASKPAAAAGSVDGAVQSFGDGIQKIEKALVDKGIADLTAAISDATNHNDNISLPCWQANLKLLQSLPSQWETPPSPIGIALGIQIQRDLLNAITGNDKDSLKVACAALWGDQIKIVANLGALIGVRIATGGLF